MSTRHGDAMILICKFRFVKVRVCARVFISLNDFYVRIRFWD